MFFLEASQAIALHYPWFWPGVGVLGGGILGSFAGCMAARVRQGVSLRHPPSFCPVCRAQLRVVDLIPIVSWLMVGGHCRYCRAPIGWQTLVWDLGGAVVGGLIAYGLQGCLLA